MGTEIERKFRLAEAPEWLGDHDSNRIEQGNLAIEEADGAEVRLRRSAGSAWLTVKRGSGKTRDEDEIELSEEQVEALAADGGAAGGEGPLRRATRHVGDRSRCVRGRSRGTGHG